MHQPNQGHGLRIWLCPALLPILKRACVGAQVHGEHGPRHVQLLADVDQLRGCNFGKWIELHFMCAQSDFAFTLVSQSLEAFD
ncbi:hypothetical protein D3C78_1717070 [compost metagenome]